MEETLFNECLEFWKKNDGGNKKYWKTLGGKWGIEGETLRNRFRQARKKLGITKEHIVKLVETGAKILLLDIETSPLCVLSWGLWEQNIRPEAILQDWHMLSWSAKWLFHDDVVGDVLVSEEAKSHDDSRITKSIWELMDSDDILFFHNGDRFDLKRLNTRFLFNGLSPVSHCRSVDTLKIAKESFNFSSNSLDYINQFLGLPQKEKTDFSLWKKAYFGESDALKKMLLYNKNDVEILEDLFLKMRPYIKNFPNMNLWSEESISVCPNCGSSELDWGIKPYYTFTGRYKGFRCLNCGAIGRSRFSDLDKDKRKRVVIGT